MTAPKPPPSLLKFRRQVDGKPAVLRWSAEVFEGKPYVNIRMWTLGGDGAEYPTKQGVTIRQTEIDQVIEALIRVRDRMRKTGTVTT
jgi:hypothetical protein